MSVIWRFHCIPFTVVVYDWISLVHYLSTMCCPASRPSVWPSGSSKVKMNVSLVTCLTRVTENALYSTGERAVGQPVEEDEAILLPLLTA